MPVLEQPAPVYNSATSLPPEESVLSLPPTREGRKRFSRRDCRALWAISQLSDRYEMLAGEIYTKLGQSNRHVLAVIRVIAALLRILSPDRVRTQATMEVRDEDRIAYRPEPDVYVLHQPVTGSAPPTGSDTLLAIEVCDTTEINDYETKGALYARAGVTEYWLLDLNERKMVAFREPNLTTGDYDSRLEYTAAESVAVTDTPEIALVVGELLA